MYLLTETLVLSLLNVGLLSSLTWSVCQRFLLHSWHFNWCLDCCPSSWAYLWSYESTHNKVLRGISRVYVEIFQNTPCLCNSWLSSMGFQSWLMVMSWFQFHWQLSFVWVSTQEPISLKLFVQVSRRFLKVKPKRLCLKDSPTLIPCVSSSCLKPCVLSCHHWPTKWLTWLRILLQLPSFLGPISCSRLRLGLMIPLTMYRPLLGLPSSTLSCVSL